MAYYWRRTMIALAQSQMARRWVLGSGASSWLAGRYVAGPDAVTGAARTEVLFREHGILASLSFLGAESEAPQSVAVDWAEVNAAAAIAVARELAKAGRDIHVSMDPSWAGHNEDPARARTRLRRVCEAIATLGAGKPGTHLLMLGMEEASRTDAILALHHALAAEGLPVGVTLQAYRRRSEADLLPLIKAGARLRLVRGAYPAGADIAFSGQAEIRANWRRLIDLMFGGVARDSGFYPIIATHDHTIQAYARERAAALGWPQGSYEIEMLLGLRDGLARDIAAAGGRMRLYAPFGREWWSYTCRRIGDNPRNAWILARSLVMGER